MRGSLHKLAFTAAVAGALGFGGTQAFAAPGAAAVKQDACSLSACSTYCRTQWCTPGFRCYGYCDPDLGCVCEYA